MMISHMIPKTNCSNRDTLSSRILDYLQKKTFLDDHVLTCVADIARHVGQNPRTVQHRLKALIDTEVLSVVDSYPRIGRPMIFVYKINTTQTQS